MVFRKLEFNLTDESFSTEVSNVCFEESAVLCDLMGIRLALIISGDVGHYCKTS